MKRWILSAALLAVMTALAACGGGNVTASNTTSTGNTTVAAGATLSAEKPLTPTEICAASVPAAEPATRSYTGAEQVLQPNADYHAIFCTAAGAVYVDLYEDEVPITVNNFVFLAQKGYYNNITFHRIIAGFMAQGGDPTGTGTGGPGYQFQDEFLGFLTFESDGVLAMANAGAGTNGSQFFITTGAATHLNGKHTVFGHVLEGQQNVVAMPDRDPQTATTPGTALQTVVIITDPATVKTTYPPPVAYTPEQVKAGLDQINSLLGTAADKFTVESSLLISQEAVDAQPEAVRPALSAMFTSYQHLYRASAALTNKACDVSNNGFIHMSYTLDAFYSAEQASAALADAQWAGVFTAQGYSETKAVEGLKYPLYQLKSSQCAMDSVEGLTYWQRGRFVATVSITIPASDTQGVEQLPTILREYVGVRIFEPLVAKILAAEIR